MSKTTTSKIQAILVVAIIIIAAILGSTYWLQSQRIDGLQTEISDLKENIQKDHVKVVAKDIRSAIEDDVENLISVAQAVATTSEVRSGSWDEMKHILISHESQLPSGSFLFFVYPNGSFYYTTLHDFINKSLTDRPYFVTASEGKVSIGTTVISRSINLPEHITAVPVFEGAEIVGIIGIGTPLRDWSTDISTRFGLTSPNSFFVHPAGGQTLMHHNAEMILTSNPITGEGVEANGSTSLKNFIEDALERKEGVGVYEYDGVEMICGYTTMDDPQWTVFYAEELKTNID